jgi:hypothetical protein
MPPQGFEREAVIVSTLRQLEHEEERLLRLGMLRQADACRRERRYWQFLGVLFDLEPLTRSLRG